MFTKLKKWIKDKRGWTDVQGPLGTDKTAIVNLKDLEIAIELCDFSGTNADGTGPFIYETRSDGLLQLVKINLIGWQCRGPAERSLTFEIKSTSGTLPGPSTSTKY